MILKSLVHTRCQLFIYLENINILQMKVILEKDRTNIDIVHTFIIDYNLRNKYVFNLFFISFQTGNKYDWKSILFVHIYACHSLKVFRLQICYRWLYAANT